MIEHKHIIKKLQNYVMRSMSIWVVMAHKDGPEHYYNRLIFHSCLRQDNQPYINHSRTPSMYWKRNNTKEFNTSPNLTVQVQRTCYLQQIHRLLDTPAYHYKNSLYIVFVSQQNNFRQMWVLTACVNMVNEMTGTYFTEGGWNFTSGTKKLPGNILRRLLPVK